MTDTLPQVPHGPQAPQAPDAPTTGAPGWSAQAWSRRAWLTHHAALALGGFAMHGTAGRGRRAVSRASRRVDAATAARVAAQAECADPTMLEALAQRAVEAATAAGASYADARVTRTVQQLYAFTQVYLGAASGLYQDVELIGLGVRTLVNGYWGFSASPLWTPEEAVRLAQDAVAQAKINARGTTRTVELAPVPVATGRWATPVTLDPFSVSIEEKTDAMTYWMAYAQELDIPEWGGRDTLWIHPNESSMHFARQEQTLVTSAGTRVSQTLFESGGVLFAHKKSTQNEGLFITGTQVSGKGWELFLEADIPGQLRAVPARMVALTKQMGSIKNATIGKYTLVCDGVTMAHLVEQTFGIATQLDRALGYEANASGTSFLDDPLGMLGTAQVAAPMVTITANRSAPAQLATVKWDAEGVEPQETTLVKNGVLVDFQTTREQAAWLAPYYQKAGKPVTSHGHAWAEDALAVTMQHMPNLALAPGAADVGLDDLIQSVKDGILVTKNAVTENWTGMETDHQARNGTFNGLLRQIKNGRVGSALASEGMMFLFNTPDLWKHVQAVGGRSTEGVYSVTGLHPWNSVVAKFFARTNDCKGQPVQLTSHSVQAPAAIITDQALVTRLRRI